MNPWTRHEHCCRGEHRGAAPQRIPHLPRWCSSLSTCLQFVRLHRADRRRELGTTPQAKQMKFKERT